MVYAENIRAAQVVMIPNSGMATAPGDAVLKVRSTVGHTEPYIECVAHIDMIKGLYFPVTVELYAAAESKGWRSSFLDGEYEYVLEQDGLALSCGLMQIGEYTRVATDGAAVGVTFAQAS